MKCQTLFVFFLVLGFAAAAAHGAIINVPGDFATIQGAIDAASVSGDEIMVAPGTYNEVINFNGKAINLHSASGNPVDTIIDGTGVGGTVVVCASGVGVGKILEGFTITGGIGGFVGGMFNLTSSPTVTNCIFSGNSGSYGGGMCNFGSNPTITNCTFSGNFGNQGGGMYNFQSNPNLTNCSFTGNSTSTIGGGMYNFVSNPRVTSCIFTGNMASVSGGGMHNDNSSPTIANCIFSGNTAGSEGGGMYNVVGSPTVTNCTFSGNSATNSGGGMYNYYDSRPPVMNCIFWGDAPEEIFNSPFDKPNTPYISFSNIQGGFLGTGSIDGGGNINTDPLFVDALGPDLIPGTPDDDLRFQPGSPCIDAGINNGVYGDLIDVDADGCTLERTPLDHDGNPRFADDPTTVDSGCGAPILGITAIVDLGAYEFAGTPAPQILIGDTNGNGLVNIDDLVDVLNAFGFNGVCSNSDTNGNGLVNIDDLVDVLNGFGGCP